MLAIELKHLSKSYGSSRGIIDVSLEVPEGAVFGLIGPNGSGKSTTLRTLLGLLTPTSGSVQLLGQDVQQTGSVSRASVGYVPGENQFDPGLTVAQVLEWRARFAPGRHDERRRQLVERFDLDVKARADDLSLGNKKKLALVAALQHRPRVIVLDEPTNGLDPIMQARLFELLASEAHAGVTVLFSSHVLSDVQRVCRTVAVLNEGRLVAVEDVETLSRRSLREVSAVVKGDPAALASLAGVSRWSVDGQRVSFLYAGEVPALLSALSAASPSDLAVHEPSLEQIVMHHYVKSPMEAAHV